MLRVHLLLNVSRLSVLFFRCSFVSRFHGIPMSPASVVSVAEALVMRFWRSCRHSFQESPGSWHFIALATDSFSLLMISFAVELSGT